MKEYKFGSNPLKVYGLPGYNESGIPERLPKRIRELIPSLETLGRRCPGGRIRFRTNSKHITFKMELETLTRDIGMSLRGCQALNVYIGEGRAARFAGLVFPPDYDTKQCEATFEKSDSMESVTVFLPRNEPIKDISILVDDEASVLAPIAYKYPIPVLYYGSSITEGGCPANLTNAYNTIISRRLDADFINFGFSGGAKGEPEMADYINEIEKSILVIDYDHNAPSVEHLQKTHEPFFMRIRSHSPNLPIVIISAPDFDFLKHGAERRDIIKQTYLNARARGDENVYFIDGETLLGTRDRDMCLTDGCHPNDLGFYRMADAIEPTIKMLLEKSVRQ